MATSRGGRRVMSLHEYELRYGNRTPKLPTPKQRTGHKATLGELNGPKPAAPKLAALRLRDERGRMTSRQGTTPNLADGKPHTVKASEIRPGDVVKGFQVESVEPGAKKGQIRIHVGNGVRIVTDQNRDVDIQRGPTVRPRRKPGAVPPLSPVKPRKTPAAPTLGSVRQLAAKTKAALGNPDDLGYRQDPDRGRIPSESNLPGVPDEDVIRHVEAIRDTGRQIDRLVRRRAAELAGHTGYDPDTYTATRETLMRRADKAARAMDKAIRSRAATQEQVTAAVDAHDQASGEVAALDAASRRWARMQAQARVDVLGQIRPMGGTIDVTPATSPAGRAAVNEALGRFPADWMRHAQDRLPLDVVLHNEWGRRKEKPSLTRGRGYYQGATARLVTGADDKGTTTHEITHHMERAVPGLIAAERAYWASRVTAVGPDGKRRWSSDQVSLASLYRGAGYGANETTRPDEFPHAYMGKRNASGSFELASMGSEMLVGPTAYEADEDFRHFILGVWAVL